MKFDYDRAWREVTRLMRDNAGLLAAMAGIFFFLPYAVLLVAIPHIADLPAFGQDQDWNAMMGAMADFYRQVWWAFALVGICAAIGTLSMLALLKLRARPTVGEAIRTGLVATLPYLGALILQMLAVVVAANLIVLVLSLAGNAALTTLGFVVAFAVEIWLLVRFSLVAPAMAIGADLNPLRALAASWRMTKGSSLRLFGFYALIFLGFAIPALMITMIAGLILALGGETVAEFGGAVVSAGVSAVGLVLFSCVAAAIYSQLRRATAPAAPESE